MSRKKRKLRRKLARIRRGIKKFRSFMRKEARDLMKHIKRCQDCGAKKEQVHHLLPLSEGGGNELCNLRALCKECHHKYHSNLPSSWFR